jgi:GT2 family glycosyltransferase
MTSANLAVRREVFEKIGGFDERYKKYAFEDRDFITRLVKAQAKMCLACDAVVWHEADIALESLARKMEMAGRCTSGIFLKDHPEEYARMGYSKLDVRYRPMLLATPAALSELGVSLGKWLGELVIQSSIMPYFLKAFCVKAVASLVFLRGTRSAV